MFLSHELIWFESLFEAIDNNKDSSNENFTLGARNRQK